MITEISNFVDLIPEDFHTSELSLGQGLYIIIDFDENGNLSVKNVKSFLIDKKQQCYELNEKDQLTETDCTFDFAIRDYYSRLIDTNKAFDLPDRKIHTNNPYVIFVKKENVSKIQKSFCKFFNSYYGLTGIIKEENSITNKIEDFCKELLPDIILKNPLYPKTQEGNYVRVYFNVDLELIKYSSKCYLQEKLFNKIDYNVEIGDKVYGLSGFLNGTNDKKQFLLHKTTGFNVNNRIEGKVALNLYRFERLLANRKLPNTVPLFIDKAELNSEFVRLLDKDGQRTFREIIRELFIEHKQDISNYYLLNWQNRKGIIIDDFDFVPLFRYQLDGFILSNIMGLPKTEKEEKIGDIFEFEIKILPKIFNNFLVKTTSKNIQLNYFGEIETKKVTKNIYRSIVKYRKSIYDFIYKSRNDAITGGMFYEIIVSGILDDLKYNGKNPFPIMEKLNILFSLNRKFDTKNNNFGGIEMATRIPEYQEKLRKLLNESSYHLENDDYEFAFSAGQLIYYILTKSQSSSKTHALMEPFISKNDPVQFLQIITRAIDQYKHALEFGSPRFEKLASEILGYECKTGIKTLLPVLLAGYFSKSLIFEKSNN
jgi:CRISPR-associated protein Csh1